jgi:hypothetical protein
MSASAPVGMVWDMTVDTGAIDHAPAVTVAVNPQHSSSTVGRG